jgi:hypothetical protein
MLFLGHNSRYLLQNPRRNQRYSCAPSGMIKGTM